MLCALTFQSWNSDASGEFVQRLLLKTQKNVSDAKQSVKWNSALLNLCLYVIMQELFH